MKWRCTWSSQLWLRFKQSQSKPQKCFQGFTGIRTHGLCVKCAAVLHQLSYEDTYIGSGPIYWIHRTRERNETYEYYVNCGHTNEMKMWSSQLWLRFKQSQSKPQKCFRLFNRIRTHCLCVCVAVLHQLSYEHPYVGSRPTYWIHCTHERNETCEYYVNCRHTNEMKMWSHLHFIRTSTVHIIFSVIVKVIIIDDSPI